MINIGIVISVSDYGDPTSNLPACKRDGEVVAKILEIDPRFSDFIHIHEDTRASAVKQRIIEFITKHKSDEVGDIIFYFTGHGDFIEGEFHYIMTDYDHKKPKQTSLENSELDNLVRLLSPKLFVKIVDACHSGTSYIKDKGDFRDYLKSSRGVFSSVYFMFSSQSDQFSYQDDRLSYFTESIVDSIITHTSSVVRYKDIIDFVSDAFSNDSRQTPFFVTQADFTETFCEVSSLLKDGLSKYIRSDVKTNFDSLKNNESKSFVDLIKVDAERYCSQDEAIERLNSFASGLEKFSLPQSLAELYVVEISQNGTQPPSQETIGRWLEQNKEASNYFVTLTLESRPVTRRVPKNDSLLLSSITNFMTKLDDSDYKTVTESRIYTVGYKSSVPLPFDYVEISVEPNYPNLRPAKAFIAPIVSRTRMRVFWMFSFYEFTGWDARSRLGSGEWVTEEVKLKDAASHNALAVRINSEFATFLEEPIIARWGIPGANVLATPS